MAQLGQGNYGEKVLAHTIEGSALQAKCGRTTIYEEIRRGRLKARKIGRRTIILDEDLRRWLGTLPVCGESVLSDVTLV